MEGSKVRETEVNKMMSEVSEVITSHLNNFVDRFEQNNKTMVSTVEILKELPIIKDLEDRLAKVTAENIQLKAKIKEMKNNKKHIMLQTEEINVGEVPVSYSEIDALVTTQVQNKGLESMQYRGGLYMDYMANQSDTDTSDSDSADDNDENPEKKWLHTPVQGTLLGTWSEKKDSNKGPAELARDENEDGVVEVKTKEADEEEADEDEEADEQETEVYTTCGATRIKGSGPVASASAPAPAPQAEAPAPAPVAEAPAEAPAPAPAEPAAEGKQSADDILNMIRNRQKEA